MENILLFVKQKKAFFFALLVGLIVLDTGFYYVFFYKNSFSNRTHANTQNLSIVPLALEAQASTLTQTPPPTEEKPTVEPKKEEVAEKPVIKPISYGEPFQWGATIRPSGLVGFNKDNWQLQLDKAKELGIGWARLNWDYADVAPFRRNAAIINQAKDNGIQVVLVIEHNPRDGVGDMYGDGLADGKKIGSAFGGQIDYYQLANEGGAQALKVPTLMGIELSDYDEVEYARVRDYIRGVSEGLSQTDPGSIKIVNTSWTHVGFIKKLVNDDVDFNMIGIDWYDWMGYFEKRRVNGISLYDKLRSFGKPLTFMEVNITPTSEEPGSSVKTVIDEGHQSEFIMHTARWAWQNRDYVKGFYVLELIDNVNNNNKNKEYYGIIRGEKEDGKGVIGKPREAFYALKDYIAGL